MSDGMVDVNWAKEHHNLWYKEEVQASTATKREAIRPAGQPTCQSLR
jgi:cytochrome b subunit of formate dehydrogenase